MRKDFVFNNPKRKTQRRYLRSKTTPAEQKLWSKIRRKQLGCVFRRQYSIGPYIVDFYCPQKRLIVEIDGSQHINNKDYDTYRSDYFNSLHIQTIRFWNQEVINSIDEVVKEIKKSVK